MKLLFLLTLLVSIAAALSDLEARQGKARPRRKVARPERFAGEGRIAAPRRPGGAPTAYRVDVGSPSRKRSKSALTRLPAQFIDSKRRKRDEFLARRRALSLLERRQTALDFYECESANPAPTTADCNVIIDQVYATDQDILVTANACIVFEYQTCRGFFCALCSNLRASTDFIGNQLSTVDTLCVQDGRVGTVVGTEPPQWDAGFVRTGGGLPTYDVC